MFASELSPVITIVDDDESVRRGLARLLIASGYQVQQHASGREFLERLSDATPACVVLDVRMPAIGGLELQEILASSGESYPIVFVTGHGDVQSSVQAMKSGAVDFLLKPFDDAALLDAVGRALDRDCRQRHQRREVVEIQRRAATLTPREREVASLVVRGLLNKQIAAQIGTTEKTVKVHRARVMAKMNASSLAGLVRLIDRIADSGPHS
jgi:FixJ family two-component response regulator